MGCFDTITADYNNLIYLSSFLPKNNEIRKKFVDDAYFQSKSINSAMEIFKLSDDGKLYILEKGYFFSNEEEREELNEFYDWTGDINFYTDYTIKKTYWVDFFLKVKNGKFNIKKIKMEKIKL